jgi:YegS/Rv2252/BmrU family lipid kinase
MLPKHCVIVNPIAGRGAGSKAIPELEAYFHDFGIDYDLVVTKEPGHAIQLAKEAGSKDYETVVAVGGDGTANEVINGLMKAKNNAELTAKLAVLPVGRGNDFSYGMGVPQELESACRILVEGRTRKIDIGFVKGGDYPDGRYFGNGVGIGFDAVVGFEAAKLPSFITGMPAYLIAALKTIFLYFKAPNLRVDIDGEVIEQPCLIVSLMNGRRMGGAFVFAPNSAPDDGLLNLCIVDQVSRLGVLGLFPKVMSGTQEDHPAVKMPIGKKVIIEALTGSLPVHADGETICETGKRLEVSILKQQLDMVCE